MGSAEKVVSKKLLRDHLKIALDEIGDIVPQFDEETDSWFFESKLYPVFCSGKSPTEVKKDYPRYLKQFLEERLKDNLNPLTEKKTKGRGGKRTGAGRPKGTSKTIKTRIYVSKDIANWLRSDSNQAKIRTLIKKEKS